MTLPKLYKVTMRSKKSGAQFKSVLVSARNGTQATRRARWFIGTHYPDELVRDDIFELCRTPDDVLDWI